MWYLRTLHIIWSLVRRRVARRPYRFKLCHKLWWNNDKISFHRNRTKIGNYFNSIMCSTVNIFGHFLQSTMAITQQWRSEWGEKCVLHLISMCDKYQDSFLTKSMAINPQWSNWWGASCKSYTAFNIYAKYEVNQMETKGRDQRKYIFARVCSQRAITPQWQEWRKDEHCVLHIFYSWLTFMPSIKWIRLKLKEGFKGQTILVRVCKIQGQ